MSDQTIFRIHREERDRFAQIANDTIRDKRLSFKATGLLCYLLSLPGDWKASQNHLATVKTDGRDSVIAGFKELVAAGYVEKKVERNDRGQIETTVWHVYEQPKSGFPTSAKPKSALPISDNPTPTNTKKNEGHTETNLAASAAPALEKSSSIESKKEEAELIYALYPRKVGRKKAVAAILRALREISAKDLTEKVMLYATARKNQDQQFTPHPSTWFAQGRYLDDPKEWQSNEKATSKGNNRDSGNRNDGTYNTPAVRQSYAGFERE